MQCSNCSTENDVTATFCANCGTRLSFTSAQPYRDTETDEPFDENTIRLPPSNLGDVIGETFSIYRQNFWKFYIIGLIPQLFPFFLLIILGLSGYAFFQGADGSGIPDFTSPSFIASVTSLILAVILIFVLIIAVYIASTGAFIHGVAQHYLLSRVSIWPAYRKALSRLHYLFLTMLLFGIIMIVVFLLSILPVGINPALFFISFLFIGMPILVFLGVKFHFNAQSVIMDNHGPIAALSRSWNLVRDYWWRTFGIAIVFMLIMLGMMLCLAVVAIPISFFGGDILGSIIPTLLFTLLEPIMPIGATLVYLDLRVRQEGREVRVAL